MPAPHTCGRPRQWSLREVLNAIFYVLRGGIAWRLLPSDLPPRSTAFRWFAEWRDTGLFETLNHVLVMADRERVGQEASPSAVVLDSQSVKTMAARLRRRDQRLQPPPLLVGQVARKARTALAVRCPMISRPHPQITAPAQDRESAKPPVRNLLVQALSAG